MRRIKLFEITSNALWNQWKANWTISGYFSKGKSNNITLGGRLKICFFFRKKKFPCYGWYFDQLFNLPKTLLLLFYVFLHQYKVFLLCLVLFKWLFQGKIHCKKHFLKKVLLSNTSWRYKLVREFIFSEF